MLKQRQGFTLVELLIVVVIIGILAAIAIPKFQSTKEQAFVATVKSDLRQVATLQEAYFARYTTYGSDNTSLSDMVSSTNVELAVVTGTTTIWSATGVHAKASTQTCNITGGPSGGTGGVTCE